MCQNPFSWLCLPLSQTHQDCSSLPGFEENETFYFYVALLTVVKIFSTIHHSKEMSIDWSVLKPWRLWWGTSNLVIVSHEIIGGNIVIFSNKPWSSPVKSTLTILPWILSVSSGRWVKGLERNLTEQRRPKSAFLIHPGELNFHINCN